MAKENNGDTTRALPHQPMMLDPEKAPRKHVLGPADDQMHVGSLVFHNGERYWVSICPTSWTMTHHIRISSKLVNPVAPERRDSECFSLHADCVDLFTGKKTRKLPTAKSVEREKRAEAGIADVGDEVSVVLRGLNLDQMYTTASLYLGVPEEQLRGKYGRLNPGMQRMNLGGRMRTKHKRDKQ